MRTKKTFFHNILFVVITASLIFSLSHKGLLKRLKLAGLDFSFQLRGPLPCYPKIIIVEINDRDITQIGRWPWRRSWHAAIAAALSDLGAQSIYFDLIFSEAPSEESMAAGEKDDELLEKAIKQTKKVYLPFIFQNSPYYDINNSLLPLKRFSDGLKGTGCINIFPDIDGAIRRIPLVFQERQGNVYPHLALQIAADYAGLKIKEIKPDSLSLSNSTQFIKIPLLEKDKMLINWAGKWKNTFKHYGFLEVLNGYKDFLDKKTPPFNPDDFKDSLCLIGVTAIGLYDIKPIPLEAEYPGVGILANTISNILNNNFFTYPPGWINILLIYLFALIPAFLIFGERPLRESIFVFLIGAIYFLTQHFLFFRNNIVLDLFLPLLSLFISFLVVEIYNFVRVSIERQNFFKLSITDGLTGLYNIRYFKMLLETEIALAKPDPDKKFSIIMSDIDHFKNFNDTYGHQIGDLVLKEVSSLLKNAVRSSDIVARYGGEEMIILLRGSDLKNASALAEKLRKNIENHIVKIQNNVCKVTVSFGVSNFKPEDNADRLIKKADNALYKAKEAGRNCVKTEE